MVAIFTGLGTGFERGSGSVLGGAGLLGGASLGRNGEQLFLNAATGNLLISQRDEFLVGRGPDAAISRTYNSLGDFSDENGDNWRQSTDRRVYGLTGSVNSAGSTVRRVSADGSDILYTWDGAKGAYVATDGAGAYDTLTYSGGTWTWTDGSSQVRETYEAYGGIWRISQQIDTDGNALSFGYTDYQLTSVTTADGGVTSYEWSGNLITRILTSSHGTSLVRTSYSYDSMGRLSTVTVDLSPNDGSVGDGSSYITTYGYYGRSKLVASITQSDGSSVAIGYDGSNRVISLVQTVASGVTRTTTIGYGAGYTTVTDPAGQVTTLDYNANGSLTKITAPPAYSGAAAQIVQFGYTGNGDVSSVTDAAGGVTSYGYDGMGNAVTQTDRLGNVVTRTYGAKNELLTETRIGSDKDSGAASHTARYVYDAENHLRYVVSAEGNVSEIRYEANGQAWLTLEYTGQRYDVSGLGASTALAEWQLNNWVAGLADPTAVKQVQNVYDARGSLSQQIRYGGSVSPGNATTADGYTHAYFTYDQAGQLLNRTTASLNIESFVYDGLGRVTASTDVKGGTTSFVFNDASTSTVVTLASGLVQTSTYDKAGELIAFTESGSFVAGGTATYKYDQNGRLRQATDAIGYSTYYLYDKVGRKIAEVNHYGWVTEYRYDARDRLVATARYRYGLSSTVMAQLADPNSNVEMASIRPADHSGDIWTWQVYDQEGRVIEAIDGDGGVTAYEYDASGRLVRTTGYVNKLAGWQVAGFRSSAPSAPVLPTAHANDSVARIFYDKDGRVIGALDGEGYLTRTVYDAAGQKVQEIAYANATNPAYRASHSLQTLIDMTAASASDRTARYVYDGQGLLRFAIDGMGQVTEYGYESNATWGAIGPARKTVRYAGAIGALGSYTHASVKSAVAGLAGNANNRTSWAVYDAANRLAYAIDATGAVTGYAYDVSGQVVRTTRYANLRATTSLPTQGDMDAWAAGSASASDRVTRNFYTDRGELRFQVDAEGYVTRYDYDAEGHVTAEIRWDNAISINNSATIWTVNGSVGGTYRSNSYSYDATGKVAYAYDGEGNHRYYGYHANGTLAWDIAMLGHAEESRTLYEYDAAGRVTLEYKAWNTAEQAVTQYGYDGHGNLVSITDPRGNVTTRAYDKLGRMVSQTNAENGTVSYEYNAFDEAVKVTDARGYSSYSYYDKLGRVIATRDAENYVTETSYTAFGEAAGVTRRYNQANNAASATALPTYVAHAKDATTTFEYDKLGQVVKTTDAEGYYEQYTLDAYGNRVSVRNKLGGIVANGYDRRGLLTSETLPMASVDANGNTVASTVTNRFEYDARGNRTKLIEAYGLAEQRTTIYVYDKADRLIESRGDAVTVSTPLGTTSSLVPTERVKYDTRGNVVETVDALGARTLFYYDRLNRKIAEIDAVGRLATYTYDKNGNILTTRLYGTAVALPTTPGGTPPGAPGGDYRETSYTYDKLNRLKTTSIANLRTGAWNGSSYVTSVGTATTSFDYDANGNVVRTTDGTGGTVYSFYDKANRKVGQVDQENYLTVWGLDGEGNAISERRYATKIVGTPTPPALPGATIHADDRVTMFTYDRNGRRLTEAREAVASYGVDGNGALYTASSTSTISYVYNGLGQVTRKTEATGDYIDYAYDGAGRLVTETRALFVDQNGASVRPTVRYGYNGLNNLAITRQGGESLSGSDRITRYSYGADGRLATMTDAAGNPRYYYYDAAGNVVLETYDRQKSDGSTAAEGVSYTRDLLGRVTSQAFVKWNGWTWAKGDTQDSAFNVYGEMAQRGINGMWQEQFAYDGAGRLWRTNSGDGVWRYFVYDANGKQTLALESEGANLANQTIDQVLSTATASGAYSVGAAYIDGINATITAYDKRGQATYTRLPRRQLNEAGTIVDLTVSRGYNAFGDLAWEIDVKGNQTNYAYNTMGRNLSIQRPTVSVTLENGSQQNVTPTDTFFYDVSGRLVGVQDANGNRTTRALLAGTGYNGSEALVTRERHADGGIVRNDYDMFGDLRHFRDELNRLTQMSYDAMGRLTQMTGPGGLTDYYAYDLLGQRIQHWNNVFTTPIYGPPEQVWIDTSYYDYYYGWVSSGYWDTQTPVIGYAPEKELTDYDLQGRITRQVAFGGDTTTISYAWNGGIGTAGMGAFGGWTQTTVMTNGRSSTEQTDVFGHDVYKSDLGGHVTTFGYDMAGRMTQRSGGETLSYSYLNTGLVGSVSSGWGGGYGTDYELIKTVYGYDQSGNKTSEVYTKEGGYWQNYYDPYYGYYYGQDYVTYGDTYQNATAAYDALGRMTSWAEAGNGTTPASSIQYEYDANGNVRRSYAQYRTLAANGSVSSYTSVQDNWYRYDAMNRVVTAKGMLSGGQIVRGYSGTDYAYDQAGQRVRASRTTQAWASISNPNYDPYHNNYNPYGYDPYYDPYNYYDPYYDDPYISTYYEAEQREDYSYDAGGSLSTVRIGQSGYADNYDGTVTVTAPPATGELKGSYTYDTLGRLTRQIDYLYGTTVAYDRSVTYNGKGQISYETTITRQGSDTNTSYVSNDYGYGSSYALGAVVSTTSSNYKNGSYQNTSSTTTSYQWWDGAVQSSISYKPNTSQSTTQTTTYYYNASGKLSSVYVGDGRPRSISFVTDMNGQVIRRDESDNNYNATTGGDPHEVWYRFSGKQLGYTGNNGTLDTDYQTSISNRTATQGTGAFRSGSSYGSSYADFDLSVDPINSYNQGGSGGSYTVRTGDTLAGIAAALWGDGSLWYKLAEANGMSAANALNEGQQLIIPSGVMKSTHNARTFKPYDPAEALGDTSPTTPQPQTPGKKGGKCGVFGQILLIVIAVAVTALTYGALGGVALTGWAAVGAGAVAGAAGSIASQGFGVMTHIQEKFSWKGVAMAALGGAVGGALAPGGLFGKAGAFGNVGSKFVGDALRGMMGGVITEGAGYLMDRQDKFDWLGVAAAGIGSATSNAFARGVFGLKAGENFPHNAIGYLQQTATSAAGAITSAAALSLRKGSSFGDNLLAALPNVIGTTIGNMIADTVIDGFQERARAKAARIAQEKERLRQDALRAEAQRRSDLRLSAIPDAQIAALASQGLTVSATPEGLLVQGFDSDRLRANSKSNPKVHYGTDGFIEGGPDFYHFLDTYPAKWQPGFQDNGGINFYFNKSAGVKSDWMGFDGTGAVRFLTGPAGTYLYTGGFMDFPALGVSVSSGAEAPPIIITSTARSGGSTAASQAAAANNTGSDSSGGFIDGVGDFFGGLFGGDFYESDSGAASFGKFLGGFIPLADARDILAGIRDVVTGREGGWTNLGLATLGAIPVVGDFGKGVLKHGDEALDLVDGVRGAMRNADEAFEMTDDLRHLYRRPSGYRKGVRDQVWNDAVNASSDGIVRDPLTNRIMLRDEAWDMGHLPGQEFRRLQVDAARQGLTRKQFLDLHNNSSHYRPELPSSNRSHRLEDRSSIY